MILSKPKFSRTTRRHNMSDEFLVQLTIEVVKLTNREQSGEQEELINKTT